MKKAIITSIIICILCFLASCSSYERREAYKVYSNRDEYVTVNCKLYYRELGQNTTTGYSSYAIQINDITAYNDGDLPPFQSYGCGIPLKSANEAIKNGFEFKSDNRIYQVTFSYRISCGDIIYLDIDYGIKYLLELYRDY